jgi:L-lactate dehydrogenase (cytochrome)
MVAAFEPPQSAARGVGAPGDSCRQLRPSFARQSRASGSASASGWGRQLDGAISTAAALPAIADAVGGDLTILVDSGVRTGLDVLRMIALGAQGVLLGRAWVYALAARGQPGVETLLDMIEREMRVAMSLTGCKHIEDVDRSILVQVREL